MCEEMVLWEKLTCLKMSSIKCGYNSRCVRAGLMKGRQRAIIKGLVVPGVY